MAEHPSLVRLARFADGGADAREFEAISEHLAVCESCRAAMTEVERSIRRYQRVEERHRQKILASRPAWSTRFWPAMVALSALVVAVVAWRGTIGTADGAAPSELDDGGFRAKGAVTFEVLLSHAGMDPTPITPGQFELSAGDGLQIRATSPTAGWSYAVIIDENGAAAVVSGSSGAAKVPVGTSLPFATRYVVDGRAAAENVVACFAADALPTAPLDAAVRGVARPVRAAELEAATASVTGWRCQVQSFRVHSRAVAAAADVLGGDREASP